MSAGALFQLEHGGNFSGGGQIVMRNLKEFSREHPHHLGPVGERRLLARNFPVTSAGWRRISQTALVLQNAIPWSAYRFSGRRNTLLTAASLIGQRLNAGALPLNSALPGTAAPLPNCLDEQFEHQLEGLASAGEGPRYEIVVPTTGQTYKRDSEVLISISQASEAVDCRVRLTCTPTKRLEELAMRLRLRSVEMKPASRRQLLRLMARSELVILWSAVEASPVTLLEAAAVGRRVITVDDAARNEILRQSAVPQGGVLLGRYELFELVNQALNSPPLTDGQRGALADRDGRAMVRSVWKDALAKRLEDL